MCGLHPKANLWESSDTLGKSLAMAPSSALVQRDQFGSKDKFSLWSSSSDRFRGEVCGENFRERLKFGAKNIM